MSPLSLGGGNIGDSWNKIWGRMDKEKAFLLLDAFVEVCRTPSSIAANYTSPDSMANVRVYFS